ncbi:MAG: hypothetical protein KIS83_16430 [Rubrivivax sp.]|nr:hypothetical protein [Rubrivivax sp.]
MSTPGNPRPAMPPPAIAPSRTVGGDAGAPAAAQRWQLRLLGAFELRDAQGRPVAVGGRLAQALVASLALAAPHRLAREALVERLWPGAAADVGRNRLRQLLASLRSQLGADAVAGLFDVGRDSLALRSDAIDSDVARLQRLARSGAGRDALAAYGGELLPGHYDDWVQTERLRLAALADAGRGAAAPLPARPSTLPHYLTRWIGADAAAAALQRAVASARLVVATGAGGSGKTRLAVEAAHRMARQGGVDGVDFVALAGCTDRDGMLDALLQALQLPASGADPIARLVDAMAGPRRLVVLDNFEQLPPAAGQALATLAGRLPDVHWLVTSRHALGLDGERLFEVHPLPLPAAGATLAELARNPAVALFADRARAADPSFLLDPGNAADVVALVRRLDGLPLAIELAAARARSLSPARMLALLQSGDGQGLVWLAREGARSGHDERQASMAQVVAWSWRLLGAPARAALAALSIFDAPFGLDAALAVIDHPQAARWIDELVARSMLHAQPAADRLAMLEVIREFAATQLDADAARRARVRRLQWLRRWAATGPPPSAVATEAAHVHAAIAAAPADGAGAEAVALALALRTHWDSDGVPVATLRALDAAAEAVDAASDAALAADAHELLAYLHFEAGHAPAAEAHAERALALATDDARRARALVRRAWVALAAHRDAAAVQALLDEGLALARRSGDLEGQARALHQLAVIAHDHERRSADAEALLAESQALWARLGDARKARARLRNRAQCWAELGRADEALACLRECEAAALADGDWVGLIDSTLSLAAQLAQRRRWNESLDAGRRCVAVAWARQHAHGLAYALWNLARPLTRTGQPLAAARLMAFAARLWAERFAPLSGAHLRHVARVRALAVAQAGRSAVDLAWAEGERMSLADAVALAGQAGERSARSA